jgi:pimeloyl-ACP methyl ester carboxylesterase
MDIVLIPGMWLDASSWDAVTPALEQAGHRTHPITLPGLESKSADRSKVSAQDHIDAVIAAIDAAEGPVVLVGHSAGGQVAYWAADARVDRVARIIFVGSEPSGDRAEQADTRFPAENGEIPLPAWSNFEESMVADLDQEQRATMRANAIPHPVRADLDAVTVSDERRRDLPITIVACEYPAAQLKEWTDKGFEGTEELAALRNAEYVDLNCGHWPQFSKPGELSRMILASL